MSAAVGCCVAVRSNKIGWRTIYKPCSRAAKVERGGNWYCSQHDPQAQADRREKQREQWVIENAESARKRRLVDAAPDLLAALEEAALQIAYLHGKFQPTGSGEAVLARIAAVIARAKGETT